MDTQDPISRRRFLLRSVGRSQIVELSCERLYVRYVDARSAACLPQFSRALERELRGADEVRLTNREWLARDDFRAALEPLLRACTARRRNQVYFSF